VTQYITFEIQTLEDIKMGSQWSQIDNQYALNYIAGSTIRGGIIHQYLKHHSHLDISRDEQSRKMFLSGGMRFLNAYPAQDGNRAYPFPTCFYTDKDRLKKYDGTGRIEVRNELDEPIGDEDKRIWFAEFCFFDDEIIKALSVDKVMHLHINKREQEDNLYRYEAIKKGQTFIGVIAVEKELFEKMDEMVRLIDNQIFYFGGSKGSGYGKCRIQNVELLHSNPELFEEIDDEMYDTEIFIYATSDIVSRNEHGEIISYIDERYLKDQLDLQEVKLEQSSIQTRLSSGYNNHWRSRLPQNVAIKAGSIFKYTYQGELKKDLLKQLMDKGIGDRKEEGFGRILVLDSIQGSMIEWANEKETISFNPSLLSSEEQEQLQVILTDIYKEIIEKERPLKVLEQDKRTDWKPFKYSISQIGKLLEISMNLQALSADEGKEQFLEYFNHMRQKSNNQKAYKKFEDAKVNGNRMIDYLSEFIRSIDDVDSFKQKHLTTRKHLKLGSIEPDLSKNYVYQSNLKFLEEYFRLGLKGVRRGE